MEEESPRPRKTKPSRRIECTVCFFELSPEELRYAISGCQRCRSSIEICSQCIRHQCLQTGKWPKCHWCSGRLSENVLKTVLALDYNEFVNQMAVDSFIKHSGKIHCPTPNCRMVFMSDCATVQKMKCPDCKVTSCAMCHEVWKHGHKSKCSRKPAGLGDANKSNKKTLKKIKKLEKHMKDTLKKKSRRKLEKKLRKWKGKVVKQCPKCNFLVQKKNGCHHMRCDQCNHEFDWKRNVKPV